MNCNGTIWYEGDKVIWEMHGKQIHGYIGGFYRNNGDTIDAELPDHYAIIVDDGGVPLGIFLVTQLTRVS